MEIKRLNHFAIATAQFDKTIQFYRDILGFAETAPVEEGGLRTSFLYCRDGVGFEIIELDAGERAALMPDGKNHIAFDVDDVKVTHAELSARGAPLLGAIEDLPEFHTRLIKLKDPNNIVIALRQDIDA